MVLVSSMSNLTICSRRKTTSFVYAYVLFELASHAHSCTHQPYRSCFHPTFYQVYHGRRSRTPFLRGRHYATKVQTSGSAATVASKWEYTSTSTDSSVKKVNVPLVNSSNISITNSANSSPNNSRAAITAAASSAATASTNHVVPPVVFSQVQPPHLMNNEVFLSQLSSNNTLVSQPTLEELILLRELQQQRERLQLMSLVQQINQIPPEDVLQLLLARQQQR